MHDATLSLCLAAGVGVILLIAGRRLHIPSIVLLLGGGVLLGPEALGWVNPDSLGSGLELVIAVGVAVILFEGGLSLDLEGYRRAPVVIKRIVIVGPLITWLGTAGVLILLLDLEPAIALMTGSLIVVTGPTVISPLLRRIHLRERLHHVLYWEGVLVDVVGVFIAVLCYEWLTPDESFPLMRPIVRFGLRLLVGVGIGVGAGLAVSFLLKRDWIPYEYVNIFVLGGALLTYGVAHSLLSEAGILSVVTAGLVIGLRAPPQLSHVKRFKLELTELGIAILFILLAAKLDLSLFAGWRLVALLVIVMFVLRPLVIWVTTAGQGFSLREKAFLSWMAPRGIVAAAMASLFSLRLQELGHADAVYLEIVTYAVIAATVTLQGLSAPIVAKLLGVTGPDRRKWLLLGDSSLVKALGHGLRAAGVKTVELRAEDSALTSDVDPDAPRFADVEAILFANTTMLQNVWAVQLWGRRVHKDACYRWATFEPEEIDVNAPDQSGTGRVVWTSTTTAAVVATGLADGSHTIDVLDVVDPAEVSGRFGVGIQPLFWVDHGRAHIVPDPLNPGMPRGDVAVVLRQRIRGLDKLVDHIEVIDVPEPSFRSVLERLIANARRLYPNLPEDISDGIIERRNTMPVAVGSGIAIPHAYWEGIESSHCLVGIVPHGVAAMLTPDDKPIRLVFLLLSPLGQANEHLTCLAALGSLGQEPQFLDLLARQRVPSRIAALIRERG